jgi:alpha-tubulin suppressor-like RCC1 family protein
MDKIEKLVCPRCGFDTSRDYTRYPTLVNLQNHPEAANAQSLSLPQGAQSCGNCGSYRFFYRTEQGALCCVQCGDTTQVILPAAPAPVLAPVPEMEQPVGRVRSVAAGFGRIVCVYNDGTVGAVGDDPVPYRCTLNDVKGWSGIVSVSVCPKMIFGLNREGKVQVCGDEYSCYDQRNTQFDKVRALSDVVQVLQYAHKDILALHKDGTVRRFIMDEMRLWDSEVFWKDIKAISAGNDYCVGLTKQGKVFKAGAKNGEAWNVANWSGISSVVAGNGHVVGIKKNGGIVAAGFNHSGQCNVKFWSGIQSVALGNDHTVGLKKNGTVVATGDNQYGQCEVTKWKDIIQVAAGPDFTVGLKKDGTVVASGNNYYGQCDVGQWTNVTSLGVGDNFVVGLTKHGIVLTSGKGPDVEVFNQIPNETRRKK